MAERTGEMARAAQATLSQSGLTEMSAIGRPSNAELRKLLFDAVRACMSESPRIGGTNAREWAVSTRVAIHLSRTKVARDAERSLNVLVDAEYSQKGLSGDRKIFFVLRKKKGMKPDIIWHKRGETTPKFNWIACEIKLHKSSAVPDINYWDRLKLQALKQQFRYRLAIWISIPRTTASNVAYYTEVNKHGGYHRVRALTE